LKAITEKVVYLHAEIAFKLFSLIYIHKISTLSYDNCSNSEPMNNPHYINKVDIICVGNSNTCYGKHE
jgi:hypothetical protein